MLRIAGQAAALIGLKFFFHENLRAFQLVINNLILILWVWTVSILNNQKISKTSFWIFWSVNAPFQSHMCNFVAPQLLIVLPNLRDKMYILNSNNFVHFYISWKGKYDLKHVKDKSRPHYGNTRTRGTMWILTLGIYFENQI